MDEFGKLLRDFREACKDPRNPKRKLSQIRLGELMGIELGDNGFSGVMVSYWESGKNKVNDRVVLLSLLKILRKHGGLKTLAQADELLEAGNYRALDINEIKSIFPNSYVQEPESASIQTHPALSFLARSFFFISDDELRSILIKAEKGPPPSWPRALVGLTNKLAGRWSGLNAARGIAWIWVWLLCWASLTLSLKWPFNSQEDAKFAITIYSAGTLIIPMLIGILTITKGNNFWEDHNLDNALITRLYTYQGAYIGYHLGYFVIFTIRLFAYYAGVNFTTLFQLLIAPLPLVMGYTAARLVPYNLWQAYERLSLRDGWIFFIFTMLGPIWGFYFYNSNSIFLTPSLGTLTVLLALTIFIALALLQRSKQRH
jgi:hypothetical protein